MVAFSSETMESKKQENDIFKALKENQPRILYPAKLSFKNEGKIKTFPNKWYWENTWPAKLPDKKHQRKFSS